MFVGSAKRASTFLPAFSNEHNEASAGLTQVITSSRPDKVVSVHVDVFWSGLA